jgi:hypothetical protein
MKNQKEIKWFEKPSGTIILIYIFFPVGLYLMWKNKLWNASTRWMVTVVITTMLIAIVGGLTSKKAKQDDVIKHYSGEDWDRNATYRKLGEKVWQFSQDHPKASKLTLIIIDECRDKKGNLSNYETKITFDSTAIAEYRTYKEASSFNKNCYEFSAKLLNWSPCGNPPY